MSFWKFGFAQSNTNAIDSILNSLPSTSTGTFTNNSLSVDDRVKIENALDSLLDNPDLLNELKSGSNQRLIDFVARAEVVNRLAGWVLWGLGGTHPGHAGEEEEDAARDDPTVPTSKSSSKGKNGIEAAKRPAGIVSDDVQDGKVPDSLIDVSHTSHIGYGNVPIRQTVKKSEIEAVTPIATDPREKDDAAAPTDDQAALIEKWSKRPRLATEILCGDVPSLDNILFEPDAATTQPSHCPRSPEAFLVPLWDTLLRSTEEQLETYAVQVGYWTRVNMNLLSGPRHAEALKVILTIPHLLQRLLALIPSCSPLSDLLLLILRNAPSSSSVAQHAVPAIVRLLDPYASGGADSHFAADELLRGIIDQCSAVPVSPQGGFGGGPGPQNGNDGGPTIEWRDTFLARQIADEKTVRTLTQWMFDASDSQAQPETETKRDDQVTPKLPSRALPTLTPLKTEPSSALRTSSLVHSIAVLVDLIRKNNSDFVEQQMLNWARRYSELELDKESGEDALPANELGPSLVDLSGVLRILTERLPDFQALLVNPRTLVHKISTTAGTVEPLTLERYRICELYAELLHCSNMGLTNRTKSPFVDAHGRLRTEWRDPEKLANLLAEALRLPGASSQGSGDSLHPSTAHDEPGSLALASGFSTPSGAGSLDSESGVLTRAEAKELHDLIAASAGHGDGDDEEGDPFGDQFESGSDEELAEAVESIQLDEDLVTSPELHRSPAGTGIASPPNGISSPHIPALKTYLPPGPSLKVVFMQHNVISTLLDLFFKHELNNFLHNVVFDVVQQIFHGRLDRPLDRQLAISVFTEAKLVERILAAQKANESRPAKTPRPGYMGHMTLIAEEIVKLFQRQPTAIYNVVEKRLPQPAWYEYVTSVLKETRERESMPLGGGVVNSSAANERDLPAAPNAPLEGDDEFPMNSSRSMRAQEKDRSGGGAADSGNAVPTPVARDAPSDDKFSRYLVQTMAGDEFGSSDEDEDDIEGNAALSHFGSTNFSEGDFDLNVAHSVAPTTASIAAAEPGPPKFGFGFDDRFDDAETSSFSRPDLDSDDDADWGPFTSDALNKGEFPSTLAGAGAKQEGGTAGFDDDDFGDFEGAEAEAEATTAHGSEGGDIFLPTFDDHSHFDFTVHSPRQELPSRSEREEEEVALPKSPPLDADRATSSDEPLGPSMHAGARLDEYGRVEAVVDGHTVVVPADDIALAHHMSSSLSASPNKASPILAGMSSPKVRPTLAGSSPAATPERSSSGGGSPILKRRSSEETRRRRSVDGQPPELSTL